jgi:starch phosphorylase
MPELAYNIIWSWEPIIRALFRRLDPNLWRDCGYNPVLMLGRISQAALAKAAADHRYLSLYTQACQRYDDAMQRRRPLADGELIGYFSAEYGLSECLPIYSGGLGILSGDHLKSASNCDLPLVGVGLLYQQGYFRQLGEISYQRFLHPAHAAGEGCRGQRVKSYRSPAHR